MATIDRTKLKTLQQREESRFLADHAKSAALYQRAQSSLLGGVPMNWMKKWAGAFPIFVKSAKGAHFTDVDNRDYVDLCLVDTGAMTGHSPAVVAEAVAALLDKNGAVGPRRGNIGPPVNPAETTRVVEFNDLNALEAALKHRDVACVLAEPAMTNVGIILPDDGYWRAARELTRLYGTLLIADETHTICAGPGGCTREWKLAPDFVVCPATTSADIDLHTKIFAEALRDLTA